MNTSEPKKKPRHRLFWRLYLYGVVLTVIVTVSSFGIFMLTGHHPPWMQFPQRLATQLSIEFGAKPTDLKNLQTRLSSAQYVTQANLAVFAANGTRLAAAGDDPPRELDRRHAFSFDDSAKASAYLMIEGMARRGPRSHGLGLMVALVIIGLVAIPMARSLARPLERLTQTARTLAEGDLTIRTNLQRRDEVGILAQTFDDMASRLEYRINSEKELLANISHELRTPLARIRVALELCEEEPGSVEDFRRHLSGIGDDANELEQLLENVFTITRLDLGAGNRDDGRLLVDRENLDLAKLLDRARQRFQDVNPKHKLRLSIPDQLPPIAADPALIRRVIDNLLDNAVKYADPETEVELVVSVDMKNIVLSVKDRGIGISEQDLPHIFEAFYRTERSRRLKIDGTGLGLTLCKRIVEAHAGNIQALLRKGKGTTIKVSLPVA
ncbi:MAG: HAMP domain-containing histidine kinase [Deltaproteobacteria bacterium]|nr:HAMP domain-containing histidine kinase [Deltaproteobacteria bacterium]MBW1872823.1 HAMP domain-containing histidine kinase [Deltaproteobacteria bacterium]